MLDHHSNHQPSFKYKHVGIILTRFLSILSILMWKNDKSNRLIDQCFIEMRVVVFLHKSQNKIFVNCTETVNIFRMLRSAQTNVLARSVIPQELRGRLTHETQFTKLPFAKVRAHIFAWADIGDSCIFKKCT